MLRSKIRRVISAFVSVALTVGIYAGVFPMEAEASSPVPGNTVRIRSEYDLMMIEGDESAGKYYVLEHDIRLSVEWEPIVDFRGTFDGQGHTISNLYVESRANGSSYWSAGLFANVQGGAVIKNLGVEIAEEGIEAENFAGGLIGYCEDYGRAVTVRNCWVTGEGTISVYKDRSMAGGLIGGYLSTRGSLSIASSYAAVGKIEAEGEFSIAGGLIGLFGGDSISTISNSYAVAGEITATGEESMAGGLVGFILGGGTSVIRNSYAAAGEVTADGDGAKAGGLVGSENTIFSVKPVDVRSSYRLEGSVTGMDAEEETLSGTPLSTAALKQRASFEGWDFTSIWSIDEGAGYPSLQMKYEDEEFNSGREGIDYGGDDIIVYGTINGIENYNYYINLTTETLTVPSTYYVAAYSVDGGVRWREIAWSKWFDDRLLSRLLNRGMSLVLSNQYDDRTKQPIILEDDEQEAANSEVVKFPALKPRPKATALTVNYRAEMDALCETAGEWVLTAKESEKPLKKGLQVALADGRSRNADHRGWGMFYDEGGIHVRLTFGRQQIRTRYLWRIAPTEDTPGSKVYRVSVMSQKRTPAYSIRKDGSLRVKRGTTVLMEGMAAPVVYEAATVLNVSTHVGTIELWQHATARQPSSAKQIIHLIN
jgi:hypothetical protein